MIKQIIQQLTKYQNANLWLEQSYIREEKKKAATTEMSGTVTYDYLIYGQKNAQVIFTHADIGHNNEEKNKIQQVYTELNNVAYVPQLAI